MCSIVIAPTVAGRAVVKPINLGEVALYDVNGTQIPGDTLTFKLSSLCCGGAYPASNCNNGNLGDFCHSGDYNPLVPLEGETRLDANPTLTVQYPCPSGATELKKVVVHNREECCQDWITEFRLYFRNSLGLNDKPSYVYSDTRMVYNIFLSPGK